MEQNNQQGGGGGGAGGGMSQGYPQYQQQPQHQLMQQQQQQLHMFWAYQMQEIEQVSDFKNHQLPLARIKKIMKADEDVRMISAEAPVLFAKACEMFILELTLRSWIHAEENKRRTLQKNDIAAAITRTDIFDFLVDIVPRDDAKDEGFAALGRAAMPEGATGGGAGPYYYPPMAATGVAATAAPPFMVGRPAMQMDPAALYMQQQQEAQRPYGMQQMWQPHQQPQQLPDGQAYGLPHQQQQMPDGQPYAMHQQQQDGHTYGTSAPSAD